jgi:hypothetical protein
MAPCSRAEQDGRPLASDLGSYFGSPLSSDITVNILLRQHHCCGEGAPSKRCRVGGGGGACGGGRHVLYSLPGHLLILQHASEWARVKMRADWSQVRRDGVSGGPGLAAWQAQRPGPPASAATRPRRAPAPTCAAPPAGRRGWRAGA